jgi:hypothetical protein
MGNVFLKTNAVILNLAMCFAHQVSPAMVVLPKKNAVIQLKYGVTALVPTLLLSHLLPSSLITGLIAALDKAVALELIHTFPISKDAVLKNNHS